jgi:hypothetical protein
MNIRLSLAPPDAAVPTQRDVHEARIALRVASHLNAGLDQLPHDVAERLRVARERSIDRARALRKLSTQPAAAVQIGRDSVAILAGPPSWWLRLASFLPLAVLVGGLLLIQQRYTEDQISAAAEVDAALLVDELPPQAYSDPGFVEFLRTPPGRE